MLEDICQNVLAFSSNLFGSITHKGGRDARVPVRFRFAANLCGITRRDARVPVRFRFAEFFSLAAKRRTRVVQQEQRHAK
jgi:hypothetical protein